MSFYTLKYTINGARFFRKYPGTSAGKAARDSRADVLATNGIVVVTGKRGLKTVAEGRPRRLSFSMTNQIKENNT